MSIDDRNDLPPANAPNFLEKVRETLSTYLGTRGNRLNRGLTVRDMADAGLIKLNPSWLTLGGRIPPIGGVGVAIDDYTIDLTPPPTPTGFEVGAAISNIFLEHAAPSYTQGHGHAKTIVYGATWISGALPVFANAVKITEFSGTVFAHPTNPATTWHLWIKWMTVDGVESTVPAGGTNGLIAITGQDVALLLEALASEITASQLHSDLSARINLIDSPAATVGSVNARLAAAELTRANEAKAEADTRVHAQTVEARERMALARSSAQTMLQGALATHAARLDASDAVSIARQELTEDFKAGDFAEATSRQLLAAKLDTDVSNALAVIATESTARATAIGAEATQRNLLATQFRGAYTGTDPAQLTEGLLYQERITRVSQGNALAQQITLLSAGAGEQFDWASIWYFDATAEGWTGNGTPTVAAGFLRPANASDPYVISPDALALDGAKYIQMRLRVRKYGNPTWAGQLRWATPALNTFNETNVAALTVPTFDANGIGLVTVTPGWTGTINRVRLDLSVDQTDTDYYTIDWVAVGRPSPGASSAQLFTLETALTGDIGAVAERTTTLETKVGDASTGLVKTVATIVDTHSTTATANAATADAQRTLLANFGPSKVFREAGTAVLDGDDTGGPAQVANFTAITLKDGTTGYLPKIAPGNVWYNTANGNKPHSWDGGFWRYTPDASPTATKAYVNSLESALTTPTTAITNAVRAMEAEVLDPVTGAPITLATLNTAQKTTAGLMDAGVSDVRTLRAESKKISETALQSILNGEAARDSYSGSLALAREELTTQIVDGISAEAEKRLTLTAVVNTNATVLTQEQATRASQFEAVAQDIVQLNSTVEGNQAALVNDYYTKANTDGAIAQAGTYLRAYSNLGAASFRQAAAPTIRGVDPQTGADVALRVGDDWLDPDDNKPRQWNGSAWVAASDGAIAAVDSRVSDVESTQIGYCLLGGAASDHTTRGTCEAAGGAWNVGLPIATAVKQVSISDGVTSATLEQRATAQKTVNGELYAQYTVKLDVNGKVSGYGLASTGPTGPGSVFEVRVDKFVIVAEAGAAAGFVPFTVLTAPTTIDGVPMPAGAYASKAFILDLQVTNAKIANLAVDDAKIENLSVSKLTAGAINTGDITSTGTTVVNGVSMPSWSINGVTGLATFNNTVVRGTVYATAGLIGGNAIDSTGMQSPGYVAGSTGWRLDTSGLLRAFANSGSRVLDLAATGSASVLKVGSALDVKADGTAKFGGELVAASGTFAGSLAGATGTFSGSLSAGVVDLSTAVGATYIFDSPGAFGPLVVPSTYHSPKLRYTIVGGGGGGGGAAVWSGSQAGGGGGGSGAWLTATIAVTAGASLSGVVGSGGSAGTVGGDSGVAGGAGTYSSITNIVQANGGLGGGGATYQAWAGSGGASGGAGGQAGHDGHSDGRYQTGDAHGGNALGAGGTGGTPGVNPTAGVKGGGGGGGSDGGGGAYTWHNGAAGGNGFVMIEIFDDTAVILQNSYNVLLTALTRQGIATI
jgi:hypothetical protein